MGSIVNAIDVLRYISQSHQPEGVTAISRALSISPSSCFNILKTLTNDGFIEFHPQTKTYALGTEALRLARRVMDENGALSYVRPHLHDIATEFNVTSALWRLTARRRWVLVGFEESGALARIHLSLGQRLPMFGGAVGRCAAAFSGLEAARLKEEFAKVNWRRQPSAADHLAQVAAVAKAGWALDDNQFNHGVATVASPILDSDGRVRYAIACTMFTKQHDSAVLRQIGVASAALADRTSDHIYGGDRRRAAAALAASRS